MGRLVLFFLLVFTPMAFGIERGSVEYSSYDIDYSKLDTDYIKKQAEESFIQATTAQAQNQEGKATIFSKALGNYKLLFSAYPDNIEYCTKIGELYDFLGKDRYAKEYFYRGITLQSDSYLPYEKFGNFYFARKQYNLALKQYIKAYNEDNNVYNVNHNMGMIYQKLGDTKSALKYYKQAQAINANQQLIDKIRSLEELHSQNTVYYQNTRIHFVED